MTRSNWMRDLKGENIFLAVHSDELLRSSSKLKRILKSSIGENIQVLDAYKEIANVYERFTDVIDQAFKAIKEKIDAVNTNCKGDKMLNGIQERFSTLYKLHTKDKSQIRVCGTPELTKTCRSAIVRFVFRSFEKNHQ